MTSTLTSNYGSAAAVAAQHQQLYADIIAASTPFVPLMSSTSSDDNNFDMPCDMVVDANGVTLEEEDEPSSPVTIQAFRTPTPRTISRTLLRRQPARQRQPLRVLNQPVQRQSSDTTNLANTTVVDMNHEQTQPLTPPPPPHPTQHELTSPPQVRRVTFLASIGMLGFWVDGLTEQLSGVNLSSGDQQRDEDEDEEEEEEEDDDTSDLPDLPALPLSRS